MARNGHGNAPAGSSRRGMVQGRTSGRYIAHGCWRVLGQERGSASRSLLTRAGLHGVRTGRGGLQRARPARYRWGLAPAADQAGARTARRGGAADQRGSRIPRVGPHDRPRLPGAPGHAATAAYLCHAAGAHRPRTGSRRAAGLWAGRVLRPDRVRDDRDGAATPPAASGRAGPSDGGDRAERAADRRSAIISYRRGLRLSGRRPAEPVRRRRVRRQPARRSACCASSEA